MAAVGRKIAASVQAAIERDAITTEASASRFLAMGDEAAPIVDSLAGAQALARDNRTVHASGGLDYVRDMYGGHFATQPEQGNPPPGRDPKLYAANPLVDEVRQRHPGTVRAARAEAPEPRLFGDSDLPLACASGVDPKVLLKLPWPLRHAAAAASTSQEFYRICELRNDAAKVADAARGPENEGYRSEVSAWLAGRDVPVDPETGVKASAADEFTEAELFRELFGDTAYSPEEGSRYG